MDKVIVSPARSAGERSYHTDPNCPYFKKMDRERTRLLAALPDTVTKCQYCNGKWHETTTGGKGTDYATVLENMDPEAL